MDYQEVKDSMLPRQAGLSSDGLGHRDYIGLPKVFQAAQEFFQVDLEHMVPPKAYQGSS